jgi:cytochrome b
MSEGPCVGPVCVGIPLERRRRLRRCLSAEDDFMTIHVWAGYVIGTLVVVRVVCGFTGSTHARFSDFVTAPAAAIRYGRDLVLNTR